MKRQMTAIVFVSMLLLLYACSPGPAVDVDATVEAKVSLQATQTALATAQSTMDAQAAALSATQAALAPVEPTQPPPQPPTVEPTPQPPTEPTKDSGVLTPQDCPFYVYQDYGSDLNHFKPAGWMGDTSDVVFDENYRMDPERPVVIQIKYNRSGSQGWSGIYWWDPPNSSFGLIDGGYNLSNAKKLTFYARGENDGEKGEFKVGGIRGTYTDSLDPALSTGPITLTKDWQPYTLDLTGADLSHIIGGFVWVTNKDINTEPATIYIDEIKFE